MGLFHQRNNFIKVQGCGVYDLRPGWGRSNHLCRDQRPRIQTDATGFNQPQPTDGDQVRRTGASTDKMDGHSSGPCSSQTESAGDSKDGKGDSTPRSGLFGKPEYRLLSRSRSLTG